MSERALGEAQRNEAQSQVPASDFGCFFLRGVLQGNLAPRGRGGGQRAVRTDRPERPSARGEDGRARAGGGWGRGKLFAFSRVEAEKRKFLWLWSFYFVQKEDKFLIIEFHGLVSLVWVAARLVLCEELADFLASCLNSVLLGLIRRYRVLRLIHAGRAETYSYKDASATVNPTSVTSDGGVNLK